MTRLLLLAALCCCSFLACKNDSGQTTKQSSSPATSETKPAPAKAPAQTPAKTNTNLSADEKNIKAKLATLISGKMIESIDFNDGNLKIQYFKNATDYKAAVKNDRLNEEVFKSYWATASRTEKVMALLPGQIFEAFPDVKNLDITIYTGEKTLNAKVDRDMIAAFLGKNWADIQKDFKGKYRVPLVNNVAKRKAYFAKFVTVQ